MRLRLGILITVILACVLPLCGCAPTARQVKATVQAGINQTQTAAVPPTPLSATPLPSAVPLPALSPTPAPVSLDFGGSGRILLQVSQCLPEGAQDCADAPAGIYLSDMKGAAPKALFDQARLLDVSADGTQVLISQVNSAGTGETLFLAHLNDASKIPISESFAGSYVCDSIHCGAIFLLDGSIRFIGIQNNTASNRLERTIFRSAADGTAATPLALSAPAANPLYFYRSASPDSIYWETGSDQIPSGVVKAAQDGSAAAALADMIQPAFAPQGGRTAYLKQTGELGYETALFVSASAGADATQLFTPQTGEFVQYAVWSPDGGTLTFDVSRCAPDCSVKHYLWRADATSLVELAPDLGETFGPPVWSPDGKVLLYIQAQSRTARAVILETGQAQPFLDGLSLPKGLLLSRLVLLP